MNKILGAMLSVTGGVLWILVLCTVILVSLGFALSPLPHDPKYYAFAIPALIVSSLGLAVADGMVVFGIVISGAQAPSLTGNLKPLIPSQHPILWFLLRGMNISSSVFILADACAAGSQAIAGYSPAPAIILAVFLVGIFWSCRKGLKLIQAKENSAVHANL